MVFAVVGCGSTTDRTVPVESNDSATGGAELRQAWLAARMREAVSQPEYQARMTERGALLPSPAQELAARLGGGRVELELAGEPVRLELGAAELTCGNRTTRLDEGELVLRENRVELEHGAVTERYLSGPAGIEQVFEVGRAACGAEARELELAFEIGGVRAEAGEGGARFVDERGRAVLSYTDLFARDASGEALSARMEVSAHRVLLRVDVAGARFPVEVDPLFWGGQKKLTASDGAATDSFGNSVALSGDTALVGALGGDVGAFADQGSAYVFVRSGATWTQQQKLVASDGAYSDQFGVSVALSGDTALVGAPSDDVGANANQGSAYVFVRNGATWAEQQKLTASDGIATDFFGNSVALSGDTALVGAPSDQVGVNADQGSAYVFVRSGTIWAEQQKLTAGDGKSQDGFGVSVALSGDTALFGALGGDVGAFADQGSAYVFVRSGTIWAEQQKLTASDGAADDLFGIAVTLSGDTALVGAHSDDVGANANQGSAYVFVRSGATWTQQQKLVASDGAYVDQFGVSVALSGDTALVGAHSDDVGANANQGSAYVFTGGSPCTGPSDCPGGTCVDGFCCDTPCADACDVCAASLGATKNGICTVLPAGATPSTCASPKACNGTSNACSAQCASDLDCAAGFYCAANGSCQAQKAQAATCNDGAGADCKVASCRVCTGGAGRCADGYCCSAACDQPCDVCSQALGAPANGTCSLAPQGVSPTGCPSPKACNGTSATCAAVCASDADCASTHYCDGSGQCTFRKVKGAACNLAAGADCKAASCRACQSDHCVDGVCCDSTCGGQCQACAEAGSVGTCKTVSGAPRAPRPACVGTTGEKCTGTCDGANPVACTYPATGTPCKGASCTGDVAQPPGICDGAGLCSLPTTKNCVPYACNATTGVCQASCSSDAECAQGAKCDTNTGKCASTSATCKGPTTVLLPNGQTESCSPYKCLGGACQQQCSVPGDCAPGYTCEATECVVPEGGSDAGVGGSAGTGGGGAGSGGSPASGGKKGESGGDDGGCGCRVPARGGGGTRGVWLGALGLALFFRRARGRSRRVGDPW